MTISEDALAVIAAVAGHEERPGDPHKGHHALSSEETHHHYFEVWPIERFNDAVAEGESRGWIEPDETLGSYPYASNSICLTHQGRKRAESATFQLRTPNDPARAFEQLSQLRANLAETEPYPWEPVMRWIASAEPIFTTVLREHLDSFHRMTKTPQWVMVPRMSGQDSAANALEGRLNRDVATNAHATLLAFIDSILALAQSDRRSQTTRLRESAEWKKIGMPVPDRSKVFIIHGRNIEAAKQMGVFVRSLGLTSISFRDLRASMGGAPTVADIVERGMSEAQGVIALFTADEFAALHPKFREQHDREEDVMRWQARPNVIFEAGMAFGRDRKRVVFVLLGDPKLFTDVAGIHVLRPTNSASGDRATLMNTLANGMNCAVTPHSTEWMTAGDLETCIKQLPEVSTHDPFVDHVK